MEEDNSYVSRSFGPNENNEVVFDNHVISNTKHYGTFEK